MNPTGSGIAQKIQLRFSKTGRMRFVSHHDLMRVFARAIIRAELPVRLTQGFDPRPRIIFAMALELGVKSLHEEIEIEFNSWIPPKTIREKLAKTLPEGIELFEIKLVPPRKRGEHPTKITYQVCPPDGPGKQGITPETIASFLKKEELPFKRLRQNRVQHIDLRPSLISIEIDEDTLVIVVGQTERGIARPTEILALLTGQPTMETRTWKTTKTEMLMAP